MPQVTWSRRATLDVVRLYNFLLPKSPDAAYRAQEVIRSEVDVLKTRPEIGRPIENLPPEFRELIILFGQAAYVARYRYDGQTVVVMAVRHSREAGY